MSDEPRTFGSPMGVTAPGTTTADRPKASPPDPAKVRAAMDGAKGESSRPARGSYTSRSSDQPNQGTGLSAAGAGRSIKDRKYATEKAIDDAS